MIASIVRKIRTLRRLLTEGAPRLVELAEDAKIIAAQGYLLQLADRGILQNIQDAECRVFSQFGEDGIIQYLLRQLALPGHLSIFVEFGVQDYTESNTRFLLVKDNWRGLVIDGDAENIRSIHRSALSWRHDLTAVAAFIDKDNINELIAGNGVSGEIGLLSIDLDGNDYWIWEALTVVSPRLVVAEYNSVFGLDDAVSVPYDAAFRRSFAHHSNLYWGASLKALEHLARKKGYALVGSNSAGNNAFFVRSDCLGELRELSAAEAYVESRFRESRGTDGSLTFLSGADRRQPIADMPLINVITGARLSVGQLAPQEKQTARQSGNPT